jgi:hypothetical protein
MKSLLLFLILFNCGLSSKAYWQQHTGTHINVVLDDKNHYLRGFETIVYANNSPDTLRYIYIHLWPNAYKNDRTQFCEQQVNNGKTDFYYSPHNEKGFIDSLQFIIDGDQHDFNIVDNNIDVVKIDLINPILPGTKVLIETPFRVKIPKIFSRLGHNGQAYFISQWYPKLAVYDYKGWHPMPYLDQGEFYSEFGSYDVTITVPKNYIVMATGNCKTLDEQKWMDSLASLPLPADTLFRKSFPTSAIETKEIRFVEDSVHDFAWFADKRWVLRRDSISGVANRGTTQLYAAFLPEHQSSWINANQLLKSTINYYGKSVGQYPYRTMKAVEGDMAAGGGMEYPTVTIIDKNAVAELPMVIAHEAGHNWFYGILASNEREFPWMDEGMNSFYEQKTIQSIREPAGQLKGSSIQDYLYYQQVALHKDQMIDLPAKNFNDANYGADVYFKTTMMLNWLESYMGKSDFENGMKSYYLSWKFKHPYPENFRTSMQSSTSKNLDWFFDGALKTKAPIDFKLQRVLHNQSNLLVDVKNKADFSAPVLLTILEKDSVIKSQWIEPFEGKSKFAFEGVESWDKVEISSSFAELKISNNQYYRKRLFHKGGFDIGAGFGLNRKAKYKIFCAPAFGYNIYDEVGTGILFHNLGFPQSKFQFAFAPQYSTGSKRVNGMGSISYSWFPRNAIFHEIRLQTNVKSFSQAKSDLNIPSPIFARYFKIAPSVEFVFRERDAHSKITRKLLLKQYHINETFFTYSQNFAIDSLFRPSLKSVLNNYALLRYDFRNDRTFHPYGANAEVQLGKHFIKLNLEAKLRIDYDVKGKSLYIRGFGGLFSSSSSDNNRYMLNTSFSGVNDYLFEGIYGARNKNEGFLSKQVSKQEGGFKLPTNLYANPLGRSDNWLLALNLKTDLPFGRLPLRLYADIATFADAKRINPKGNVVSFNAGLELSLFKELISIYAPLLLSTDYSSYLKEIYPEQKFLNSITFSINIERMNGLRAHEYLFKELIQ